MSPGRHAIRSGLVLCPFCSALAAVRAGNAPTAVELAGIEYHASAACYPRSVAMSAFRAFLLLIAVVRLAVVSELMAEPAPRRTLVLNLAAPAAFPLLDHLAVHLMRPTRLAQRTGARSGE